MGWAPSWVWQLVLSALLELAARKVSPAAGSQVQQVPGRSGGPASPAAAPGRRGLARKPVRAIKSMAGHRVGNCLHSSSTHARFIKPGFHSDHLSPGKEMALIRPSGVYHLRAYVLRCLFGLLSCLSYRRSAQKSSNRHHLSASTVQDNLRLALSIGSSK